MYKKTKLDNGLRVVSYHMPTMRSVALGIWIKVGSRYESAKVKGISHFLEHLAFKGTKNYSCRKLKESIEGVGGSLNGFTSEELTCYLAKLPAPYLNLAFDILSDMVINPSLPNLEIEKERTVILEELKMHKDLPQSYVYELLDTLLWPEQPLGMSIMGTEESISQIDKAQLASFNQECYSPANIVISVAGALQHTQFIKRIENKFRELKAKKVNTFLLAEEKPHKPRLSWLDKATEQTHLTLGFHSFKKEHPLKHALGLLHIILGANMSSRLFNEIREKRGLAYEIGAQVKRFSDTGAFIVHAGIDNRKVEEALKLILVELQKIKDKLVSPDEFRRAKEFYLGQLMLALEDTLDHMAWIGESVATLGRTYTLDEVINELKEVGREDIRKAANCIFKEENLCLALIGALKDSQERIAKQLHLN